MLGGDQRRLELAYSLMFSMPGTPVLRYGDEVGMGDDLSLPERNCARTPMQWSDEPQGGFSKSEKTVLPVISGGPYGFQHINVASQRRDPNSMLNWTERMIRMRHEAPEIGWGSFVILDTGHKSILAVRYDWRNNSVLTIHNLSEAPIEFTFDPDAGELGRLLIDIFDGGTSEANDKGIHRILMEPYGYRWFRVGGLDYLLRRTET
jgi:maltose alpha-D-glucosyltransferase/alpha-amylase